MSWEILNVRFNRGGRLKSINKSLRNRGMAAENEIAAFSNLSLADLIRMLNHSDAFLRSAAAMNLHSFVEQAADDLLLQLSKEKHLYTRIAICECLEKGGINTARKMINYLGCIGNNQHKVLPDKVSAKKSFPLPRDIIARSLGRMDASTFPALMEILKCNQMERIYEDLDAIGYMVFYKPMLATKENCEQIVSLLVRYEGNQFLLWKILICLSAFPCEESKIILTMFAEEQSILGLEAQRSLNIIKLRN